MTSVEQPGEARGELSFLLGVRMGQKISVTQAGCWNFATLDRNGYGKVRVGDRTASAHRVMWEGINGSIPAGMQIDHLCRNRACCNPAHLEVVTHSENQRRKPNADTCPSGHEFTEANTMRNRRGHRKCRECNRLWSRRRKIDGEVTIDRKPIEVAADA